MAQDSSQPIHLSVHERSDPSVISSNPDAEVYGEQEDLNDSVPDQENRDVPIPSLTNDMPDETVGEDQIMSANRRAG